MTDHDFTDVVRDMFETQVPFNRLLGIELGTITEERIELAFPMRDELIGSFVRGTLHGGVISAVLDVAGGLAAFLSIIRRKEADGAVDVLEQFGSLGSNLSRQSTTYAPVPNAMIASCSSCSSVRATATRLPVRRIVPTAVKRAPSPGRR